MRPIPGVCAIAVLALVGAACAPSSSGSSGSSGSGGTSAGVISGTVRTAAGKPIAAVRVSISGALEGGGYASSYQARTDASGHYQIRPTKNEVFHPVQAEMLNVNYEGHKYEFNLDPVHPTCADFDSTKGLVQDFVWKVSGQRPCSNYEATEALGYNGGEVYIRGTLSGGTRLPYGTKISVTLVPSGPLMDGTTGRTITKQMASGEKIDDVPLGKYRATVSKAGTPIPTGWCYPFCSTPPAASFTAGTEFWFPARGAAVGSLGFGVGRVEIYG